MKYIRFDYSAGYCGTDTYEFGKFEDTATDEEIGEIAEQICRDHCEMYGVYEESGDWSEDDLIEAECETELDYSWKEVPESEVEMNRCTDYTK